MEKNRVLPSTLYLVATPIGNLDDISYRALKVLKECDFIAAEDTRVTAKLLSAYEISKPMTTYEQHSLRSAGEEIIRRLGEGMSCALVTDAGTPGISDPGEDIVRLCIEKNFPVIPIPGACAAINALIISGFSTRRFVFEGFLEGKTGEKRTRLEELSSEKRTLIFYEAPHRIAQTLMLMAEILGEQRRAAFCRELTKLNEEVLRLTLREARDKFSSEGAKGELVIIVEGNIAGTSEAFWSEMSISEHVRYYTNKMGLDRMSAVKAAAKDRGVPKNKIYKEFIEKKP